MRSKLQQTFFARNARIVARALLGCTLVIKHNNKEIHSIIVETESYHGTKDPASRAYKGKNKISTIMWDHPGIIMIYNVHKYLMFNIITGKHNHPSAVLIRALEPLNYEANTKGPGLLTQALNITKSLQGTDITQSKNIWIEPRTAAPKITTSHRIGVTKDLEDHHRFFIANNPYVSKTK